MEAYIGGESLRLKVAKLHPNHGVFYHTGGLLDHEADVPCYPVGVLNGKVISLSTEHPNVVTTTNQFQAGWKEGSVGRLLPGFAYEDGDSDLLEISSLVFGVDGNNQVETRATMDEDGFLYL